MAGKARRFGVIREDGTWLFEPRYAHVGTFNDDRVPVSDDNETWGYADASGKLVIEKRFGFAYNFVSDAASVSRPEKPFAVIDRAGKPLKLWRDHMTEQRIRTSTGTSNRFNWEPDATGSTKFGFLDERGETVVDAIYACASSYSEGFAWVRGDPTDYNTAYLDVSGKVALGPFDSTVGHYFHEGWARIQDRKSERWYFIDRHGKVVLKTKYRDMRAFYEGFAVVQSNKAVKRVRPYGYIDKSGAEITKLAFTDARRFVNGFAAVATGPEDDLAWGFIDTKGKQVIKPKLVEVGDFADGVAPAAIEGPGAFRKRWGLVDRTGVWIVEPTYASISNFAHGLARFIRPKGDRWLDSCDEGLLDTKGSIVVDGYARIEWNGDMKWPVAANQGGAPGPEMLVRGGKWGFLDRTGKPIIPCTFAEVSSTFANGFGYASVAT